jgi:uncharacterized repeat protein (TIGR01451 family)
MVALGGPGLVTLADNATLKPAPAATKPVPLGQILHLPIHFEKNEGQTEPQVQFLARGPGYTLFLGSADALLSLRSNPSTGQEVDAGKRSTRHGGNSQAVLRMSLRGGNPQAKVEGLEQLPGTASYFLGNDPQRWHAGIPMYSKVRYEEVYPGIDLVYYGDQRQLEYDFVVGAKAEPSRIGLRFTGAEHLEIDSRGDLIIHLGGGTVRLPKPLAYQKTVSGRKEVPASFKLREPDQVAFELGAYDSNQQLVIDPQLLYSTYLGGSGDDFANGVAVDTSGNVYVMGDTTSPNFPTHNAFRSTMPGLDNIFVTKFNASGTALVYSTYLGGSSNDLSGGIALDNSGNVYVTGQTTSPNFPTKNPFQSANAGLNDVFVSKLGPFGTNLLYSSYLGGAADEGGIAIAADNSGIAYVTGYTFSLGTGTGAFPTTPSQAFQRQNGGGSDAFVAKFNTTLSGSASLVYSTFLGGTSDEQGNGITFDSGGNAYVVGEVDAYPNYDVNPPTPPQSNFPLLKPFQSLFNQGYSNPWTAGTSDGFLTKLNAAGTALLFSTFLGGAFDEAAYGVTLDSSGRIYIVGETDSTNFPVTPTAAQLQIAGDSDFPDPDAFVVSFQANGTNLYYSTYLGGSGYETGEGYRFGIAVDRFGQIYVTGQTASYDFPLTVGADQTNSLAAADSFITKINPAAPGPNGIVYSTLLTGDSDVTGGEADSRGIAIAVDSSANFYVAGITSSTNFLVTNAFDGTFNGGFRDSFVAKFSSPPDLSVSMFPSLDPVLVGSNVTYSIYVNNNGLTTFTGVSNFVQFGTNVPILAVSSSMGNWTTNSTTNGTLLIFNIGTMTNNAVVHQSITIGTQVPQVMTNTATAVGIETVLEPNTGNNVATVLSTVRGFADVSVSVSTTPNLAVASSNLSYNITVGNKGPWPATSIVLTDALPANLLLVSATNTFGTCSYDTNAGFVVCYFNTLTNGANATASITAMPLINGMVTNVINAEPFELGLNQTNNTTTIITTAAPYPPFLQIVRSNTNFVLYWPTNEAGFSLQSKSNLNSGTLWKAVSGIQTQSGSFYFVTDPAAGSNKFYRLIK